MFKSKSEMRRAHAMGKTVPCGKCGHPVKQGDQYTILMGAVVCMKCYTFDPWSKKRPDIA